METMDNAVNPTETEAHIPVESGENVDSDADDDRDRGQSDEGESRIFEDGEDAELDEDAELAELCRVSGVEYGCLTDFSGYQRYLELKRSGVLTSEEAFYAVTRGKNVSRSEKEGAYSANAWYYANDSKHHMTASRRKPSSGEVFSRADREELAKWGISATGSELERLWRQV